MTDEMQEKIANTPTPDNAAVFGRIVGILEEARGHVAPNGQQRYGGRVLADRT